MSEKKTTSADATRKKYESLQEEVQAYNRETRELAEKLDKDRREGLKSLMDAKQVAFTDLQEAERLSDQENREAVAAGRTPAGTPRNPATPHQVDERTPAPEDADRTPVIREDNPDRSGLATKRGGKK